VSANNADAAKERCEMKIVATVDFSMTSEDILKTAKTYAKKLDAEVFLIHAEPDQTTFTQEEKDTTPEAIRLKKDAQALEKAGVKVTSIFLQGPVCEVIMKEAVRLEADLIITGAHGHGKISCKIPVGHVSECILLKANIPVMIVPSNG
jgi:nucleotide-binding universal stress UspA family protein